MSDVACYVFDIDGVLANNQHRLGYITGKQKNWPAYHSAAKRDTPLPGGLALAKLLAADAPVLAVTGRPHRLLDVTRGWFDDHGDGFAPHEIITRADVDHRPNHVFKVDVAQWLNDAGWTVRLWVDDNPRVLAPLTQVGVPTLIVAGVGQFTAVDT